MVIMVYQQETTRNDATNKNDNFEDYRAARTYS